MSGKLNEALSNLNMKFGYFSEKIAYCVSIYVAAMRNHLWKHYNVKNLHVTLNWFPLNYVLKDPSYQNKVNVSTVETSEGEIHFQYLSNGIV